MGAVLLTGDIIMNLPDWPVTVGKKGGGKSPPNDEKFRLCYYIIGKKPGMKGKWVFGQFATMLPPEDFKWIVDEAKRQGWI